MAVPFLVLRRARSDRRRSDRRNRSGGNPFTSSRVLGSLIV